MRSLRSHTNPHVMISAWFATVLCCTSSQVTSADEKATPHYQLDNGLTVMLRPLPAAEQVAVVVLFSLGNAHDPIGKSGQAHLVEHLYATSATATSAARDVNQIVQRYARQFNMQTGYDYTVIAGVVGTDGIADELEDTAARMANLRITQADLDREIPRMLDELKNMYGGIPSMAGINHVRNRLLAVPRGGRYAGAEKHLKTMSVDEVQQVWQEYYKPNNAILVVAGGFEEDEVRDAIKQHFGQIPAGKPPPKIPIAEKSTVTVHRVSVSPLMPDASGVVAIGYAAPTPGTELHGPFLVVVSRLWAAVMDQFQAGMPPPVFHTPLDEPTVIVLLAKLPDADQVEDVLNELDERLEAALTAKVKPQDRQLALNSMAMLGTVEIPHAVWRQNVYGLAFSTGRRLQLGIDGKTLSNAIKKTSDADIQRVAETIFASSRRVTAVIEIAK